MNAKSRDSVTPETQVDHATESPECAANTPLEYMLAVMRNLNADPGRRDRMAVAAAPYLHPKAGEQGKKESKKDAADRAATGRFAAAAPPKSLAN